MIIAIDKGKEGGMTELSYETQGEKIQSIVNKLFKDKSDLIKFVYKEKLEESIIPGTETCPDCTLYQSPNAIIYDEPVVDSDS